MRERYGTSMRPRSSNQARALEGVLASSGVVVDVREAGNSTVVVGRVGYS
jgi:hypothetical protein